MPLSHAILGFLDYQPMSGYGLKKLFDQSVAHFWSATQSHIYKALENLEAEGWVESKIIPQEGRPNRKEYHITRAGRAELRRWIVTPLPLSPTREAWLIQIFFSHASSNEEIVMLLQARAKEIRARLAAFHVETNSATEGNTQPAGMERMRQLWQMTADYGRAYYESELAWIEDAIERARKLPPPN